jgi:quercetin dioxygenase-like cupin family protein
MDADTYSAKPIAELPTLWDGFASLVRDGLEIEAFGAQIMHLPPDYETKSHDESASGQEELYVGLAGAGAVVIEGAPQTLDPEHLVAVGPNLARTLRSGPDGLRVLCVGSVPGAPYVAPGWTASEG